MISNKVTQPKSHINKRFFDGVQVSVNSDDEDLDSNDDVDMDNEHGSIDQEHGSDEANLSNSRQMIPSIDTTDGSMAIGMMSASLTDKEMIMNNPHLKKLPNKILDERIQNAKENGEPSTLQLLTRGSPNVTKTKKQTGILVKSHSDMMIYMPALN